MTPVRRSAPPALLLTLSGCLATAPPSAPHPLLGHTLPLPTDDDDAPAARPGACRPTSTRVFFWSPSCAACKPWLAELDRLHRRRAAPAPVASVPARPTPAALRGTGAPICSGTPASRTTRAAASTLVGVVDGDERGASREVLDTFRIAFPQLADPGGALRARYAIRDIPALVVFDPCGRLVHVTPPTTPLSDLERTYWSFD